MPNLFPPAFLFIIAAFVIPFLKGRTRDGFILLVPIVGFFQLINLPLGSFGEVFFLEQYKLVLLRVETIRLCFAYVFVIIALFSSLYAIHVKKAAQHTAAFAYIGSSLGVVFAGDYFTLFVFWEIMAVASTVVILCRGNRSSREAGYRYVLVHVAGGAILMAGIILQIAKTGSIAFVTPEPGLPFYFILVGFCLNAAVPPLSAWLSDAYPEASVTGAIYLTTYTTKTAVFVLAYVFAGTEVLVWAGAVMTLYGVVFATMENDIRRLLAFHIISQVGYMVCGVGLGSELAVNGSCAHAFSHILYKALLFMGTGAVLHATGKSKMTELGGLYKLMPWTMVFYMVAGFSISGVPLFNGFISKSLIISGASELHRPIIELMLTLAAVGTFFSTTLKLPYYTFFGADRKLDVKPLPKNMSWAMGFVAALCFLFGVYPDLLYRLLPFDVEYHPYTRDHVVGSMELLIATGLAFMIFLRRLGGHHTVTTDTDWIYRRIGNRILWFGRVPLKQGAAIVDEVVNSMITTFSQWARPEGPDQALVRETLDVPGGTRETIGLGAILSIAVIAILFFLFMAVGVLD